MIIQWVKKSSRSIRSCADWCSLRLSHSCRVQIQNPKQPKPAFEGKLYESKEFKRSGITLSQVQMVIQTDAHIANEIQKILCFLASLPCC